MLLDISIKERYFDHFDEFSESPYFLNRDRKVTTEPQDVRFQYQFKNLWKNVQWQDNSLCQPWTIPSDHQLWTQLVRQGQIDCGTICGWTLSISQGPNFDTVDNTGYFYRPQVAATWVYVVNRNGPGCERPPVFVADVRSTTEKMKFSKEQRWTIAHFSSNGSTVPWFHCNWSTSCHWRQLALWYYTCNNTHKHDGKTIYDTDPEFVNWQNYY